MIAFMIVPQVNCDITHIGSNINHYSNIWKGKVAVWLFFFFLKFDLYKEPDFMFKSVNQE